MKSKEIVCGMDIIQAQGFFIYRNHKSGCDSLRQFWDDFQTHQASFDDCIGSYRIHVKRADGTELFFGDNAGVQVWYVDEQRGLVLERLSEVPASDRKPDYASIAQFLWFGCIYGMGTILQGVYRTDPEYYYIHSNGSISKFSKQLTPLEQLPAGKTALEDYVKRVLGALEDHETIGCTITGGMDSRSVLAHLHAAGISPRLSITGTADHKDVQIAKEIAHKIGQEITVLSGCPTEGAAWLEDILAEVDGQAGACGAYRLLQQFQDISNQGVTIQFGGMAGELYKNSFINQDYPFYIGKPNWQRFLKLKVIAFDFPMEICGEALEEKIKNIPAMLLEWIQQYGGSTKASAYLNAGYRILQARAVAISEMGNRYVTTCNPLIERCVAAAMFKENPYALEMQMYQRQQVAQFFPDIMDIPTDRGLTCNPASRHAEWLKSTVFLLRVASRRLLKRGCVSGRIDVCMEQGMRSQQYMAAVDRCKELGIIRRDTAPEALPRSIADRVLSVGDFFKNT